MVAGLLLGLLALPALAQPRMSIAQLKSLLGSPALTLVDVRAPRDWRESDRIIPGARRLNPGERWVLELPHDRLIVFYCA